MASSAAYSPLPTNSKPNTGQGSHLVAVVSLLVTVVTLFLAFLFHSRWDRDISDAPFHLPTRQYTFTPDRRLQDFDQDTLKLWQTIVPEKWWETNLADWQDASGHQLSRAVDVIHMIVGEPLILPSFLGAEVRTRTDEASRSLKALLDQHPRYLYPAGRRPRLSRAIQRPRARGRCASGASGPLL